MTDAATKLGIIAGAGEMPLQIVRACERAGRAYFVVAVDEFAMPLSASVPHARIRVSKIGAAIAALKRNECKNVVFAGRLARPDGQRVRLRPDWGGFVFLARNLGVLRGHNDGIHRAIAAMFAREGLNTVSPLEAAPELAAKQGCLTKISPPPATAATFQNALRLAKAHGLTKEGQAVVVRGDEVVARERRPGTDAMLMEIQGAHGKGAILVKAMAPNQLTFIDPPAIGESTVVLAAAAGLAGILIEAGSSVIVDEERVRARADELGLFIVAETADAA